MKAQYQAGSLFQLLHDAAGPDVVTLTASHSERLCEADVQRVWNWWRHVRRFLAIYLCSVAYASAERGATALAVAAAIALYLPLTSAVVMWPWLHRIVKRHARAVQSYAIAAMNVEQLQRFIQLQEQQTSTAAIAKPPAHSARRALEWFCTRGTWDGVFKPLFDEAWVRWIEANAAGDTGRATRVHLWCWLHVAHAVAAYFYDSLVGKVLAPFRRMVADDDDRRKAHHEENSSGE